MGELDQDRLMDAISNAATIAAGKARWTITNVFDQRNTSRPFLFGKLSKFSDEGHVKLVDTKRRSEVDAIAENLLIASANFVYLPQYSGLAYMHVWNHIEADTFARRFKEIIEATYDNFFVGCCVEAISDYRSFGVKLRGLDRIHELSARVHPPNPLFGRLWGSLNDYVAQRNASEVSVRETQDSRNGLVSKISELVSRILENPEYQPEFDVAIGDAAILMAADGYGSGRVVGEQDGEEVTIRTSDAQKTFLFSKEPKPADLADEAEKHFQRTSAERDMRHP
ncbi:hypothetical protein [Burkholderia multivorans]|uniref:hypothetical protein n=2 Tax=Burkholderia multivorans TaxID=87883 RepID=UPI0011B6148B|nr:hypothetical protein [Burkholderia multivorans]MBR7898515.1 hypothetical protein [Burkholderia multivorans]HEM8498332.1 hypothetical protein [Burkholderia multivorans]